MSTNTAGGVAPWAEIEVAVLAQRVRELEEKYAFLERTLQMELDEAFFAATRASLDSHRTQVRTGTRDGEWMERGRHHG